MGARENPTSITPKLKALMFNFTNKHMWYKRLNKKWSHYNKTFDLEQYVSSYNLMKAVSCLVIG